VAHEAKRLSTTGLNIQRCHARRTTLNNNGVDMNPVVSQGLTKYFCCLVSV